jgi:hypothetical protein
MVYVSVFGAGVCFLGDPVIIMSKRLKDAGVTEQFSVILIKVFAASGTLIISVVTLGKASALRFGMPLTVSMSEVYARCMYAVEILVKPKSATAALVMINCTSLRARSRGALDPI